MVPDRPTRHLTHCGVAEGRGARTAAHVVVKKAEAVALDEQDDQWLQVNCLMRGGHNHRATHR